MAVSVGPAYILDDNGTIVYQVGVGNGDVPTTVSLNGNTVTIASDYLNYVPTKRTTDTPIIDTVGIVMVSEPTPDEYYGGAYKTTITLPFSPASIKFASGMSVNSFDNTTRYLTVGQGQSATTEYDVSYSSGSGMCLQYFIVGGGECNNEIS